MPAGVGTNNVQAPNSMFVRSYVAITFAVLSSVLCFTRCTSRWACRDCRQQPRKWAISCSDPRTQTHPHERLLRERYREKKVKSYASIFWRRLVTKEKLREYFLKLTEKTKEKGKQRRVYRGKGYKDICYSRECKISRNIFVLVGCTNSDALAKEIA